MNNKVLVTGGAGFIGSHCVDALLERGDDVTVFDIKSVSKARNLAHVQDQISYVEGDIRDRALIHEIIQSHTHILHLAAIVSVPESIKHPAETHDTNVTGTLNVFSAACDAGIKRVVYASSAAVYGDVQDIPTRETAAIEPISPYGMHKMINEQYGRLFFELYGLPTYGLRLFNVYGSRQDPSSPYSGVVTVFREKLVQNQPVIVYGDGTATRDFVHVYDVVKACMLALDTDVMISEIFNVGSGRQTTLNHLLETMELLMETTAQRDVKDMRPGDILHSCAHIEKIGSALGFTPTTDLKTGLEEVIKNS
jgi:UDP-glucose 4-epimerase